MVEQSIGVRKMTQHSPNEIIEKFFKSVKEKFETDLKNNEDETKSLESIDFKDGMVEIHCTYWQTMGQSPDNRKYVAYYNLDQILVDELTEDSPIGKYFALMSNGLDSKPLKCIARSSYDNDLLLLSDHYNYHLSNLVEVDEPTEEVKQDGSDL